MNELNQSYSFINDGESDRERGGERDREREREVINNILHTSKWSIWFSCRVVLTNQTKSKYWSSNDQ